MKRVRVDHLDSGTDECADMKAFACSVWHGSSLTSRPRTHYGSSRGTHVTLRRCLVSRRMVTLPL